MSILISWVTKTFLTEAVLKKVVIALGDYLIKSTKNKLDDILWAKVKLALK